MEAALLEITALFSGGSSASGLRTTLTAPPSVPVGVSDGPQGSLSSLAELPTCAKWVLEDKDAPGSRGTLAQRLVLEKWVVNGKATFLTNKAFEVHIMSRDALDAAWQAKRAPSTELFLHPDDSSVVCSFVGQLWKSLEPVPPNVPPNAAPNAANSSPTPSSSPPLPSESEAVAGENEKTCVRDLPSSVRLWASWPRRGYVSCDGRVQVQQLYRRLYRRHADLEEPYRIYED